MISDILIRHINNNYKKHDKRPDKLELTSGQFEALISEYPYYVPIGEATETRTSDLFMGIPIEIIEVEK